MRKALHFAPHLDHLLMKMISLTFHWKIVHSYVDVTRLNQSNEALKIGFQ